MANIQTFSRFSVLEQDSADEEHSVDSNTKKSSNAVKNAKKRARKKKKAAEDIATTNELRNLAFSKPISKNAILNLHKQRHQLPSDFNKNEEKTSIPTSNFTAGPRNPVESVEASWNDWILKDEEYVLGQFQKDIEKALRLSEADTSKAQRNVEHNTKKKTSKKQPSMSLDEFSKLPPSNVELNTPVLQTRNGYSPEDIDPNHFQCGIPPDESPHNTSHGDIHISNNTSNTSKKKKNKKKKSVENKNLTDFLSEAQREEKIHTTTNTIDPACLASWQDNMEKKDSEIKTLKDLVETLKENLNAVKLRNKQLCFMLAQGEMKDKAELLETVDDLTNVKNELSNELAGMYSTLEQERSKVSDLKTELARYRGSRTKSKSVSDEDK